MAASILILVVKVYRLALSPLKLFLFGPAGRCRFQPSCSAYAIEALREHGAIGGGWLAAKRLCRCHPWGGCGDDPVPLRSMGAKEDATLSEQIRRGTRIEGRLSAGCGSDCAK